MLRGNKVKKLLNEKKVTVGSWMSMGHESIAEIISASGFDWVGIDMEHSVIDIKCVQNLIAIIEANNCVPLVRITGNDPDLIKRVMDAGAYGIIVPMINSAGDAERALKSMKYSPLGTRSVGLARAQKYGPGFEDYVKIANRETILIVQIEHISAVNNINEILEVKDIDGLMIGPYDLSGSLGVPGQLKHPKVEEARQKVLSAAKAKNIAAGTHIVHPSIKDFEKAVYDGYRFIAYGTDILFIGDICRDSLKDIRRTLE